MAIEYAAKYSGKVDERFKLAAKTAGAVNNDYEFTGVDTVKEFRHRVAANLQKKMEEVNAEKNLVNRVPSESELQKMIDQAKEMEVTMTY